MSWLTKHHGDGSKLVVAGYNVVSVVGAETITTTVPEPMQLLCAVHNTRETFCLTS
jgi:hypothetical protein